jgi:hypothetical protein
VAIDYAQLADVARELVEEAGREVTFIQYNETASDPSRPWRGAADPRVSVVQEHELPAVAVDVGTAKKLGMAVKDEDLLKRVSQFLVVAPGDGFSGDLRDVHEAIDEGTRWQVLAVDVLRPASVTLLYYVAVAR